MQNRLLDSSDIHLNPNTFTKLYNNNFIFLSYDGVIDHSEIFSLAQLKV